MIGFWTMFKYNIKIMLRNKASVFLVFLIPIAATLMLKIPIAKGNNTDEYRMKVTVFDNSKSFESEELIKVLNNNTTFNFTVKEDEVQDLKDAKEKSINLANKSINRGFIYIPSNFSESIANEELENIITIFSTGTDDRLNLLKRDVDMVLSRFKSYLSVARGDKEVFKELLKEAELNKTIGQTIITSIDSKILDEDNKGRIYNFGYFIAIMALTLIFSGNFIADILTTEKNNKVLKRISITKSNMLNYGLVKAVASIVILLIQSFMVVVGIKFFVNIDTGLNIGEIAILIFGLGLILNTLRLAIGTIFESASTANYVSFFIISISSLLSGLYFSLDNSPKWMQNVSLMMPQRWVVKTAEQILLGTSGWVILFGIIVMAFVAVFMSIGALGLKFNSK